MAAQAVALLGASLPRVVDNPDDIEARTDALYGAWLAAAFRAQAGVEHALAQRVRQAFGLDHSHCHAIFTPYAIAFNAKAAPRAMESDRARARRQGRGPGPLRSQCPDRPADRTERPRHEGGRHPEGGRDRRRGKFVNPRPVSRDDIENLITQAFHGEPPRF